jgi:16S rRNA (cytidine1402-2'-O)-methyltransferase
MKNKNLNIDHQKTNTGTLYVVSTPIGNLEDITLRAIRVLKDVDIIGAESAKHTKRLCDHYDIRTKITSYNQHNHNTKARSLLERLKAGKDIALVTSAGTPTLSDPGGLLIKEAYDTGIKVSPVPGPSAAVAALSVCGLKTDRFVFMGFLSSRQGKRKKELRELIDEQKTMILYESPRRILRMLRDIKEILGDRKIVVLRELTKVYEEILHDDIKNVIADLEGRELLGEFTLIVEGKENNREPATLGPEIIKKIEKGLKNKEKGAKDLAIALSNEYQLNYRTVYRKILDLKREKYHR